MNVLTQRADCRGDAVWPTSQPCSVGLSHDARAHRGPHWFLVRFSVTVLFLACRFVVVSLLFTGDFCAPPCGRHISPASRCLGAPSCERPRWHACLPCSPLSAPPLCVRALAVPCFPYVILAVQGFVLLCPLPLNSLRTYFGGWFRLSHLLTYHLCAGPRSVGLFFRHAV